MKVSRENTGELTATIKVEVTPADYSEKVNKQLKDYQKRANVPGFRPGHVPFGMIKKLYGSSVFAEEVNKIVSEALFGYINDEKLEVLGQPIPNSELTPTFDWKEEQDIALYFDMGLSPNFDLIVDEKIKVPYKEISVNDEMLDKYVDDLCKRHGNLTNPEKAGKTDTIIGTITQLDENGEVLEGGITNHTRISLEVQTDKDLVKKVTGLMAGDTFRFFPTKSIENKTEISSMLNVKIDRLEGLESEFSFHIDEISKLEPAVLGEELYKKAYPDHEIKDEKEFREQVRKDAEASFVPDSDHLFMHEMKDELLRVTSISLPMDFLKKWIVISNEGRLTEEQVEKDIHLYEEGMKWQMIENRIIRDNELKVEDSEVKAQVKDYFFPGWRGMSENAEMMGQLEAMADNYLKKNADQAQRLMDAIYDKKIIDLVKSKVTLEKSSITYDEFMALDAQRH